MPERTWHDLFAYWRDHHVDGHPPSRDDIDPPLEIPDLLPNLMLVDVVQAGFRMRLVGSELVRRTRVDATGSLVEPDRIPGPDIPRFSGLLGKVAVHCEPVLYHVEHSVRGAYSADGILLPLVNRAGAVAMVLGGFFFEHGRLPDIDPAWDPGPLRELSIAEELARIAGNCAKKQTAPKAPDAGDAASPRLVVSGRVQ